VNTRRAALADEIKQRVRLFAHDEVAGLYLRDGNMCHVVVACSRDRVRRGLRLCRTETTGTRGGGGASWSARVMSTVVVKVPALALATEGDFQWRSAVYQIHGIGGHRWREGVLQLQCAGTAT
jgi:hypothetical protein